MVFVIGSCFILIRENNDYVNVVLYQVLGFTNEKLSSEPTKHNAC